MILLAKVRWVIPVVIDLLTEGIVLFVDSCPNLVVILVFLGKRGENKRYVERNVLIFVLTEASPDRTVLSTIFATNHRIQFIF